MSLYKYLAPERIEDVLVKGTIAVSPPTERNDPFDELPAVDWDTSDAELEKQHVARQISISSEEYKQFHRDQKPQRSAEVAERLRQGQAERFGAVCLSRVWDSVPMWSYYAHEHRGFVIEIDETHPAFVKQFSDGIFTITYANRGLVRGKIDRTKPLPHMIKSPAWAHEQEARILYELNRCIPLIIGDGRKIYVTSYPREAVTKILLGCRIKSCCKAMIQQNLRRWGFNNASVVALRPHHEHFSFALEDLPLPDTSE